MDVALDRRGKDARFAVRRSYQPARIERELLAQVFDVVQRSAATVIAQPDQSQPPARRAATRPIDDDSGQPTSNRSVDDQHVAPEPQS